MESPSTVKSLVRTIARRLAPIFWLVLIIATIYTAYFTHLGIVGFVGPDEPRYAWIARDMAESGDWITPRLYGKPWFEKPPLYYWSAAVSFKLFGVSETSARLPSAIYSLLATLAMAWLAWRIYGGEAGRWLLVLLPTTAAMIGFSHAAATDMPFAATLTLAMVPAAILLKVIPQTQPKINDAASSTPASPNSAASIAVPALLFGLFLGLGVLAKGPAALILTCGAVVIWAAITQGWRDSLRLVHPAAIVAFCLIAVPWFILCAIRNPDFLKVFILEHNFKRFLTPEFQHIQPFWFYAEILLIAFLPWTVLFLWSLFAGVSHMRRTTLSPATILLLCWSGFCVVFFTISRSKLPGYILPAIPAIALLLIRACTHLRQTRIQRWSLALVSLAFAVSTAIAFSRMWNAHDHLLKRQSAYWPLAALILLLLTASNFLFGLLILFGRRCAALIAAVLPFFGLFWMFDQLVEFTPLSIASPRYLANQIAAQRVPLSQLRVAKLRRATLYGVNFYLRADLQEWDLNSSREVFVLTDGLNCSTNLVAMTCEELWTEGDRAGIASLLHLTPKP